MTSNRKVRFSTRAEADLRDILQYTWQTWGMDQHDAYATAIANALDELVRYPALGRPRDDLRPGTRSLRVKQHTILYLPEKDLVMVLRIVHVRRDIIRLEE